MTDFGPPADHCLLALQRLAARLKPGFVDIGALLEPWTKAVRDGQAGTRKMNREMVAMLPPAEDWPALEPSCGIPDHETPPETFVRDYVSLVYAIGRWVSGEQTKAVLPYLQLQVADRQACAEHLLLDGIIRPYKDPLWGEFNPLKRWGCRCTTIQMNARVAARNGLKV